ncbi:hypothetical protein MAM1_0064d03925 [Mucor ambiguus]|uniref:Uncharacterized protein n=1 Tax=Mucor ambiguus TaxID=91626 RepID=A0A0C9LU61_9FUNG|nr:hypothetical protein MAM1_0064d03925 [Mucor ambiguus]
MWKGRFKKSYVIFQEDSQSAYTPNINLDINEDVWASLYANVVQRQDKRNQSIACSDRLATTSALYKQSNAQYRDNLLTKSSSHKEIVANYLYAASTKLPLPWKSGTKSSPNQ